MRRIFFSSLLFMALAMMGSVFFMQGCSEKNKNAEASGTGNGAASSAVKTAESAQAETTVPLAPKANVNIVYYFMTTQRCVSCMKIEAYTKEAIEKGFAESLKKKDLVWRMVNVDESGNSHFIKDYQLFTKSVVLVKMLEGKQASWKNLDKVWELLNDKTAFQKYVTEEVKKFVGKSS
jgi:hypothetical protein